MQIAVITVQREPMYLYDTLESLRLSGIPIGGPRCVDLFVGSHDGFEEIAERTFAQTRPSVIPNDLWRLIEPLPPKLRAVGNFIAALRWSDDDLMLFEDDVAIKPDWLNALWTIRRRIAEHRIEQIRTAPEDLFVSLYSHVDQRQCWCPRNDGITPNPACPTHGSDPVESFLYTKPITEFYGTLGLFVPGKHRKALAEEALINLQPWNPLPVEQRHPFDACVQSYINNHRECSLAISIPSYVDHVGDVSIINPAHGIRRAPMF